MTDQSKQMCWVESINSLRFVRVAEVILIFFVSF